MATTVEAEQRARAEKVIAAMAEGHAAVAAEAKAQAELEAELV